MLITFCEMLFRISVQEQSARVEWKFQISKFKGKRRGGFVYNLPRPRSLNEFFEKLLKIHLLFPCRHFRCKWGFGVNNAESADVVGRAGGTLALLTGDAVSGAESTDGKLELPSAGQGSGARVCQPCAPSTCSESSLGRIFSCCKLL